MSYFKRTIEASLRTAFCIAFSLAAAAGAAEPAGKPGAVTVLDEVCVDRRTEMCLRLAQSRGTTVLESTLQYACPTLACERGWYKWEIGQYGRLGPICECERRSLPIAPGERCAEGFRELSAVGPDGAKRAACELPNLSPEPYPGGLAWPTTPFDLMTCLQFARLGPGSVMCRRLVQEKDK
ncbi:MAG TPA: hypothetical protein VF104_04285 [Burkholderiales bacterium]